jgi:predicted porin
MTLDMEVEERKQMKRIVMRAALVGACAGLALPAGLATADETSDLRAEIAAQRAQIEAQRLRLEALEKKLDATAAAQQAASQQAASQQAANQQGGSFREALSNMWTSGPPQTAAERLVAAANDVGSGITFQVTPADSVTLYGLLDITLSTISNANAKGGRKTGYQVAWFSGDRWGITGRHALGPTLPDVIFKLESEFVLNTGEMDTPGVLFNRDAWIGFESEQLGKLTFGRQNALARDYSGIYGDPYGSAPVTLEEGGYTNTNNFKQLIYYAASATGTRYDNGIVWKKKWGANWVSGLGYQFSSPAAPGDFSRNTTQSAAFGYNGGVFNVAGFYNHINVNGLIHKAWSIGGNVTPIPLVRLNAGYYDYKSEQGHGVGDRKDHAYTVSAKFVPEGPWDYELGYQVIKAKNAGFNSGGNTLIPYQDASGVTLTGTGDKKTLYGSVFYHFDRRTEAYLAADWMKLKDGYHLSVTNGHDTQNEVALGLRFRF